MKMRRRRTLVSAILFFGLLAGADHASASPDEARERFRRGEEAYARGEFDVAIAEWQAAFDRDPRPRLQYNLAQAYERIGRLEEAREALEYYLREASVDDPTADQARARLEALKARIARTAVRLVGGIAGAEFTVDGVPRGTLPHDEPVRVDPGEHRIEVRTAEGRFTTRVMVPAGHILDVPITLETTSPSDARERRSVLPWVLIGAGAGAAITAGVLGGIAVSRAKDVTSPTSREAERAHALAVSADVLGAISLVALTTGAILAWVRKPSRREEPPKEARLHFEPLASPSVLGLTATGSFD